MWIERLQGSELLKQAATRPVVLLTGARQTGKSSLLQRLFPQATYVTFDHLRDVEAAKDDPAAFLGRFSGQVILDEIQYVPELLRELKIAVDRDRGHSGRWILTGSQRFELMASVSESLAGRIGILNLETLSAKELRQSSHPALADFLWKGGYPELWAADGLNSADFHESYLRTYIERDLKQIIHVRDLSAFRRFLTILAARSSQLLNNRDVSSAVGVADVTVRSWIHALAMSGVVHLLPPFFANIGKRLVKAPKLYFSDHGLLCHLLGVNDAAALASHPLRGSIWENLVFTEIMKTSRARVGQHLFFYRDQNGVEVDFVIDRGARLCLLECKASARLDNVRSSLNKVKTLLESGHRVVVTAVAHPVDDDRVVKWNGHLSFNPLRCDNPF